MMKNKGLPPNNGESFKLLYKTMNHPSQSGSLFFLPT